jgi:hypothetical protein
MRRRLLSVVVASMVLCLSPGLALAIPLTGTLDQSAPVGGTMYTIDDATGVTQTITPSKTGMLSYVELYCSGDGSVLATVSLAGVPSSQTCSEPGWMQFFFSQPVQAGQQITLTISTTGDPFRIGEAAADYAGGSAARDGSPIDGVSDFAFRTYMYGTTATTYAWSAASVQAGVSTPVTLTTTTVFGPMAVFNVAGSNVAAQPAGMAIQAYLVRLGSLPSWFSPTGITCSTQIAGADCTLEAYQAGIYPTGDGSEMTVVIEIAGTASPAVADGGGSGTANGEGCLTSGGAPIVRPNAPAPDVCDAAQAVLGVDAAATPSPSGTPTPPAASTASPTAANTASPTAASTVTPPASSTGDSGSGRTGSDLALPILVASLVSWALLGALTIRRLQVR